MLKDVTEVRPLDGYRLHIHFEDGVEGVVDLAEIIQFTGVFAPQGPRLLCPGARQSRCRHHLLA